MARYYSESDLRQQAGGLAASAARESLSLSAKTPVQRFDVFLSHSIRDALVIHGLRSLLEGQGVRVYVDWLDDPELDRAHVSPTTAARLRERMKQSESLIYATSSSAKKSRWMPWELGYFDGIRDISRISILPIGDSTDEGFDGQEYLGLYKVIEKVRTSSGVQPYAVLPSRRQAEPLRSFAKGLGNFEKLVKA